MSSARHDTVRHVCGGEKKPREALLCWWCVGRLVGRDVVVCPERREHPCARRDKRTNDACRCPFDRSGTSPRYVQRRHRHRHLSVHHTTVNDPTLNREPARKKSQNTTKKKMKKNYQKKEIERKNDPGQTILIFFLIARDIIIHSKHPHARTCTCTCMLVVNLPSLGMDHSSLKPLVSLRILRNTIIIFYNIIIHVRVPTAYE